MPWWKRLLNLVWKSGVVQDRIAKKLDGKKPKENAQ